MSCGGVCVRVCVRARGGGGGLINKGMIINPDDHFESTLKVIPSSLSIYTYIYIYRNFIELSIFFETDIFHF